MYSSLFLRVRMGGRARIGWPVGGAWAESEVMAARGATDYCTGPFYKGAGVMGIGTTGAIA